MSVIARLDIRTKAKDKPVSFEYIIGIDDPDMVIKFPLETTEIIIGIDDVFLAVQAIARLKEVNAQQDD